MKRLLSIAVVVGLVMSAAPALAQQTSTTLNSPQSNNNGIANPVGQNTNVQVNNSYAGMNSFGVGIECATPYVALGLYNNNTSVNNGTVAGVSSNAGSNNSLGGTVQFVVPVGGKQQSNCTSLSNEIVHQHQLDTQITLIQRCSDFAKAGIALDPKVYPELASACSGVHVTMTPQTTSMASPAPQVQTVTVPKLVVYKEPAVAADPCSTGYHKPTSRDKRLMVAWRQSMRHKLSKRQASAAAEYMRELQSDCVDPIAMAQGLDGP